MKNNLMWGFSIFVAVVASFLVGFVSPWFLILYIVATFFNAYFGYKVGKKKAGGN